MYILKLSYKGADGIYHEGGFFSGFGMAYRPEYEILEPNLETTVNSVGHFSFTVYPSHPLYEYIDQPKAVLEVVRYGIDEPLFVGRMAECTKGLYNEKVLTFESELSYLLDSIRTNFNSVAGYGCEYWLSEILEYHNSHAGNFGSVYTENIQRKFRCGKVSDSIKVRCTNIPTETFKGSFSTLEIIRKLLLERYGGVLKIRHVGGVNYVDWLEENDLHVCSQRIELASNLLNIENSVTTDEIVTAIRPVGENVTRGSESVPLDISLTDVSGYISDENIFQVTDDTVSSSSELHFTDTLYSRSLVNRYGWICHEVYFSGVTSVADLTKKAVNYLNEAGQKQSIVLNAVDLSAVGNSIENFLAGDMAVVSSPVHSFYDRKMLITSVTLNLSDPGAGEIVLGNQAESITSQVGTKTVSGSSAGGYFGGGGSGDIDEVVKTAVEQAKKYTDSSLENKVDKEDGKSLSTNDFTDEYKSQIDTNTSDIDKLKSRADAVDVNVSDLSDKVKQNTADTEQLKSKTDATDDVVAHLSESLQNAVFKSSIDTELSTTSENPVQNKVVSANINSLTASVNYMSEHKADTTTVNGVISDVSKLNSRVTANETAINSNTSNINAVDARVDSLFEADVQFNKDIASVNATATIAKTKAETNQTDIAANKSEIALNKTTLGYTKKNLCPVNSKTMSANGWVMGGGGTDVYKVYIPKGKYIFTFKQTAIGQSEVQFFNSTNTQITRVLPYASTENSSLKFTITLSEDCYGMKFYNNSGVNTYSNIMIRDAAITDTTFEPYVESVDERLNTNETEITKLILNKQETEFKLNNVITSVGVNQAEIETLSENLNKFTSQSQLYSNTTDGSSPLTVTVSNLFAEYSAVICNIVTSSGKYSLTLPLRYIKSLGTSAYYEAEGLLFYYVDDSTMTVKTGLGQSNPTINSIKIIKLY